MKKNLLIPGIILISLFLSGCDLTNLCPECEESTPDIEDVINEGDVTSTDLSSDEFILANCMYCIECEEDPNSDACIADCLANNPNESHACYREPNPCDPCDNGIDGDPPIPTPPGTDEIDANPCDTTIQIRAILARVPTGKRGEFTQLRIEYLYNLSEKSISKIKRDLKKSEKSGLVTYYDKRSKKYTTIILAKSGRAIALIYSDKRALKSAKPWVLKLE